ncbi:MAG: amidohydrolase [Streptosporangiales bacterium]|nr:amidohydrolase [Streptosporangiales bacterium]
MPVDSNPYVAIATELAEQAVADRRDLHRHAEPGWMEFRTTARIVTRLRALGWRVRWGKDLYAGVDRLGVPSADELAAGYERAVADGADVELLEPMAGGWTGCVAELDGAGRGRTVALRFDIDGLAVPEASSDDHLPAREGFASVHEGIMHACGHDTHTAMGLGVAEALARTRDQWQGTVRLVFQPGEEGCRGAESMVTAGLLDGVDAFLAPHVGAQSHRSGEILPGISGFLATSKLDVHFAGKEAHAGLAPETGHNALIAAAAAALQLHAMPRHADGNSRVNVGRLDAGTGRNVVAGSARMLMELRSESAAVVEELERRTRLIVAGTAAAHEVESEVVLAGKAPSASSDERAMAAVAAAARGVPGVVNVGGQVVAEASDDATAMMRRVQEQGGVAAYLIVGTDLPSGHHTPKFDVDERVLPLGVATIAAATVDLLAAG